MLLNFFSNLVWCVQIRARAQTRARERKSANVLNAKERHPFSTVGKQQFPEFTNANDNQLKSFDDTKGRQMMTRRRHRAARVLTHTTPNAKPGDLMFTGGNRIDYVIWFPDKLRNWYKINLLYYIHTKILTHSESSAFFHTLIQWIDSGSIKIYYVFHVIICLQSVN